MFDESYMSSEELAAEEAWLEEHDRHVLPRGLEDIPTGLFLAAIVSTVDRSKLNGYDVVRLMQAEARLASSMEAAKLASMAEVAYCPPGDPDSPVERDAEAMEYAAVEIAAALSLTRRSAERQLSLAVSLHGSLQSVMAKFTAGEIDYVKAREFADQLGHLDDTVVTAVLDRVLDDAARLTTGQLRARLARCVMEADPDGSASSFEAGLEDRKVTIRANPDFTANLTLGSVDPIGAATAMTHIDGLARALKVDGDTRTLDQVRADVALDLLQGKCQCESARPTAGRVVLRADLATLAGLADTPGELAGYGPVIADVARLTAAENIDGEWVYEVTDNGRVVATGTTRRRPTAAQQRALRAEHPTCTFVGCRMPAFDCDLDHHRPHSRGGPTHNDNLAPLCRHHHMAKHHAPWQVIAQPNRDLVWTSPLGHTYVRKRGPPY